MSEVNNSMPNGITGAIKRQFAEKVDDQVVEKIVIKYFHSLESRVYKSYTTTSMNNTWNQPDSDESFLLTKPVCYNAEGLPEFWVVRGRPNSLTLEFSEKNAQIYEKELTSFEIKAMIYSQFKLSVFKPPRKYTFKDVFVYLAIIIISVGFTSLIWTLALFGTGVFKVA